MNPSVLDLNFLPVQVDSDSFTVFAVRYPGDEEFQKLPESLGPEWQMWRDRRAGNTVYLWSREQSAAPNLAGVEKKRLRVSDSPPLVSRMILDAYEAELMRLGFSELGYRHKCFVNFGKGNFLASRGQPLDERVGVFPKISVNSFFTSFKKGEYIYGLLVGISTLVKLNVPLSELVERMDCRGLYLVFRDEARRHPELAGFEGCSVGKLTEVVDGKAVMEDLREPQLQRLDASTLYVEPSQRNLALYIQAVAPTEAGSRLSRLRDRLARFGRPKENWRMVEGFKRKFYDGGQPRVIDAGGGLQVRLRNHYQARKDSDAFKLTYLRCAVFNHDYESWKTSTWADGGLKKHGPYDQETFKRKDVRILVIAPEEHKGEVEKFIKQFENGLAEDPKQVFSGFVSKYHLRSVTFDDQYFPGSGGDLVRAYEQKCLDALASNDAYDLALLVIRDEFEALPTLANPYYVGKALLLSQGIPVQEVKIETIREPLRSLRYILNNIGLASYAKLGGTPYVLRAEEVVRKELVIGIGRAIDKETRLSQGKQVIGFTTVFKNNGDFLLSSCTPYCDFADYEKQLEDVIVSSVQRVAEREGYEDGEELRIIFHVFKRTGRRENKAVTRALARLDRFQIEYALLHVNDSHLFRVYDRTNAGDRDEAKAYVPPRGLSVEIGPRERLINLIGPKQYLRRGFPTPLRLTLDQSSTFKDIDYLSQQLYEFSFMSWRGFNPSIAPVTVLYSEWIARLNSKLRRVPNWNQNMLRTQLADKRWFL